MHTLNKFTEFLGARHNIKAAMKIQNFQVKILDYANPVDTFCRYIHIHSIQNNIDTLKDFEYLNIQISKIQQFFPEYSTELNRVFIKIYIKESGEFNTN